ncbi:MAG: DNA adenine methylase [Lachnospiraceae bacterium]|nr:DNA adenine methylase [Lachnospiraceae bacterium]
MAKSTNINNRRYLGNKYKLLPFIKSVIDAECTDVEIFVDIFAGTGAVASAFQDRQLITNDILYSNYICNYAWFSPGKYSRKKVEQIIDAYNAMIIHEENYMTINFSDTYFSHDDCSKIGFIREDIEKKFTDGEINERERALLITSLLYAMDKIAKTCGHYDAYRQGAEFDMHLELYLPEASTANNKKNKCFNTDSNELAGKVAGDLIYIDPPYNSRQYCDTYHLLENVARWEKPEVFGVARKMDRTALKSRYCTRSAAEAFEDLVNQLNCKYIALSYNNMAKKGNDRSNARISDQDIFRILSGKGEVKVFSEEYKAFTAGKSDIEDHQERLFLCKCEERK